MNKPKYKLLQLKSGTHAVLKLLLSLKLKNYLTSITEQQNHSYMQSHLGATQRWPTPKWLWNYMLAFSALL